MTKQQKARLEKVKAAEAELKAAGCVYEKRPDKYGFTETGWWNGEAFLSNSVFVALSILRGN